MWQNANLTREEGAPATTSTGLLCSSSELSNQFLVKIKSEFFPVVKCERQHRGSDWKCCIEAATKNVQKIGRSRKRRKSQRCNPNYTTSCSGDDWSHAVTLNELSFEIDSSSFQQAVQTLHCCVNALHPLLMNGRWAEFERLAEELLLKDDVVNPTREIIVVLEKDLAFALRMNDLERTEDMMNNTVKKIEQTSGSVRLLLEVFSKCYLASLYRRRKMFGKAEMCLEVARKIASGFPPCLPVMLLLYELGSFKMEIASMFPGSRTEYSGATEGKKLLDSCVKMCVQLDGESFSMYYEHHGVTKIALMNLNCETSVSRNKDIKRQKILETEKRLDSLESEVYRSKESQLSKIYRLLAKMDLFYRRNKYHDAKEIAQETLELVETLGFKIEVTRLQARLTDIRRKIRESSGNEAFRDRPKIIGSCSSTNNSSNSSEHEALSSN